MSIYKTLISTAALAERLGDPELVLLDCRFALSDPASGLADYTAGHIPGARYAHLDADLSGPKLPHAGRHPLPTREAFEATLAAFGVGRKTQVVAYDQGSSVFASRLWWLLRVWWGHEAVAVLDGGLALWQKEGREMSTERPPVARAKPYPAPAFGEAWVVDTSAVHEGLKADRPRLLVDARSYERFLGRGEVFDPVGGHIPGAHSHPFDHNIGASGCFLGAEELRAEFADVLADRTPAEIVHYCGSGVSACHNVLAMMVAGWGITALYPGSWSAWVSDPTRPVERE